MVGGPGETPPSETLNVAGIGVGGKGYHNLLDVGRAGANIVALCDVDVKRAGTAFEQFPEVKRYRDFRKLLEREEKNIDAVVVTTPDHVHIPASVMAIRMGKHVYCEKPLGQNISEIRLAIVAWESGGTQMGNGAQDNYRQIVVRPNVGG